MTPHFPQTNPQITQSLPHTFYTTEENKARNQQKRTLIFPPSPLSSIIFLLSYLACLPSDSAFHFILLSCLESSTLDYTNPQNK